MTIPRAIFLILILSPFIFYPKNSFAKTENAGVICIQVIAYAINPETGKCETFSTPCDIPKGWTASNKCDDQKEIIPEPTIQINIPIKIDVPKSNLPFTVITGQTLSNTGQTSIESKEIIVNLTAPQAVVTTEDFPLSVENSIQNVFRAKVIDFPKKTVIAKSERKEPLLSVDLITIGKEKAYKVKGSKRKKILGLIPITIQKEILLSLKNGKIIREEMTFLNRLLEKLSF